MTSENLVREAWWRTAVIYEIALISFQDSGGDGKGDLTGLMSRIDYLKWLGVDAVWLTPIYKSPFRDLGYDISDYCSIDPAFGDLDGFDRALGALHAHGIRLILDLVPNHTANDHEWFVESRSSSDNPKADWYIWADAAENGGPPNNWLSRFGGSAGNGVRRDGNTTITRSWSSNQTSTGATRVSSKPWPMSCASGSIGASTVSVSMPARS